MVGGILVQLLHVAAPQVGESGPLPGPQVGDVDQPRRAGRREDDVAQVEGAEVDAVGVEPGDEAAEQRAQAGPVLAATDDLAQALALQRRIPHGIALDAGDAVGGADYGAGDAARLQYQRVVGKALRIGIPGCRRNQPLAAEQLEVAAVRQLQHLVAVQVAFEHRGIGAQGEVGVVGKGLQRGGFRVGDGHSSAAGPCPC
jgi:hypothetical protein